MIDAQAVDAKVQELTSAFLRGELVPVFEEYLQHSSLEQRRDDKGNYFLLIPGTSERVVILGTTLTLNGDGSEPESHLNLVAAIETVKALIARTDGALPCKFLIAVQSEGVGDATSYLEAVRTHVVDQPAAYLAVHVRFAETRTDSAAAVGVVESASPDAPIRFNPRLQTLCKEAVRELTGTSLSSSINSDSAAVQMAASGTPTALMYLEVQANVTSESDAKERHLHLLQAAEAFGRWVESTMHLIAGEEPDLWALEERVPHSSDASAT